MYVCPLNRDITLHIYKQFPFFPKLWLETIMFLDNTNSVPNNYHYEHSLFVRYKPREQLMHQCIHVSYVGQSHQFANKLQSNNHFTSPVSLCLCHTKRFGDSRKKQDASRDKQDSSCEKQDERC